MLEEPLCLEPHGSVKQLQATLQSLGPRQTLGLTSTEMAFSGNCIVHH